MRDQVKKYYKSEEGQDLYRRRGYKTEPIFGHFKHNMGIKSFLLRGFDGVKAELDIFSTNYNLTRLISIFGAQNLREILKYA